jgi:ATP-dependent helicase/nuclease subunit A
MQLTPAQQQATTTRGNVLVMAGAGTGKTRTLVERCLACLVAPQSRGSLDELLMVTFTEAAAAEMRQRIRARLEEEAVKAPDDAHWREQLGLFESAHIGTLHSFCLQLVRQHFYELDLDPQVSVLAPEEARLLAEETLDSMLASHYGGTGEEASAVQALIQTHGRGSDKAIRCLVLRLHEYTQTLPDAAGWLEKQLALFAEPKPSQWRECLAGAVAAWRGDWLPVLEAQAPGNEVAARCASLVREAHSAPAANEPLALFESIAEAAALCPNGKKKGFLKPLEKMFAEAAFLKSLLEKKGSTDPLVEDWNWVRGHMRSLLELTREFSRKFADAKRETGMMDFHDLEQHALRLLWDPVRGAPTRVAQEWRAKLRYVFVDEYQDINAAQDRIIEALSREGTDANRFLVGDIKQSIYRFRLANPYIFQGYMESWHDGQGTGIPLVENFRSREGILDFVNSLFSVVMKRELGGLEYNDEQARLRFGAPGERAALSNATGGPCVELHIRLRSKPEAQADDGDPEDAMAEVRELEEAAKEARLLALRLRQLKVGQHPVWDENARGFRPVDWGDMAILLRAPANKAESYAKEFARANVPLHLARAGFYEALEISDLVSLLQILDNPLQDLPLLAVLRSPLAGLGIDELGSIRLSVLKAPYWTALHRWHQAASSEASTGTRRKVGAFLERFGEWRRLARQVSLSKCLEKVLSDTHYTSWLLTQPRGEQRHENVQRLVALAQQFDQFQRQGLFRFLRFIEAQQLAAAEPEVSAAGEDNAVRLMSIHQSKGLEFPVVVVADLGKPFNFSDLRAEVILDEQYGLCPQVKPPHTGRRYPSLPYWLASKRQHRELLAEELRLLYVATTRARDLLVLSATVPENRYTTWKETKLITPQTLSGAKSFADWLGLWFGQTVAVPGEDACAGENGLVRWEVHDESQLILPGNEPGFPEPSETEVPCDGKLWSAVRERLDWAYPFIAATREPAKTSVSALRRRANAMLDSAEAAFWPGRAPQRSPSQPKKRALVSARIKSAADAGTAHHKFMELVALECTGTSGALRKEAERMAQQGALSQDEVALLNIDGLAAFWKSDLGRRVCQHAACTHRELAFTARVSPQELQQLAGSPPQPGLENELVVVQGVVDLVVLLPSEIWIVDFKTDHVESQELAEKARIYEPQLKLYALALARIYRRPVAECWLYFVAPRSLVPVTVA